MVYYATAHFKPTPPHHTCFCSFWSNWKPLNTFHLKIIWIPHSAKPSDPLWIPGDTLCSIQFTHLWQYESPCLLATEIINPTKAFFPSTKSSSLFLPCLFFFNVRLHPIQLSDESQFSVGNRLCPCVLQRCPLSLPPLLLSPHSSPPQQLFSMCRRESLPFASLQWTRPGIT